MFIKMGASNRTVVIVPMKRSIVARLRFLSTTCSLRTANIVHPNFSSLMNRLRGLQSLPVDERKLLLDKFDISDEELMESLRYRLNSDAMEIGSERRQFMQPYKTQLKRKAAILMPLCTLETPTGPNEYRQCSALLFTVRSLSLRKHAGEVSFPGGIHDDSMDGDQLERTAVRETVEELPSLTAENIRIIGSLPAIPDKSRTIQVQPFVGYVGIVRQYEDNEGREYYRHISKDQETPLCWNDSEVSDVFAMALEDILDAKRIKFQQFRQTNTKIPVWLGPSKPMQVIREALNQSEEFNRDNIIIHASTGRQHYRIWGLSAFVLSELVQYVLIPWFEKEISNRNK